MAWRSRTQQWLGAAIVIALATGLFWVALKHADTAALDAANDVATETLEKITIKPKKTNIVVKLVGLVWAK